MIRKVRIAWQVFFLVLFFLLLHAATQLRMGGRPLGLFLWLDPLIGVVTTAAGARCAPWLRVGCVAGALLAGLLALWPGRHGRTRKWLAMAIGLAAAVAYAAAGEFVFHPPLALGLVTVISAIVLGRAFCGWVCPFGTIHHFISWLSGLPRSRKERIAAAAYRPWFGLKYCILAGVLTAALLGVQQAGLLDPMALLTRSITGAVLPALDDLGGASRATPTGSGPGSPRPTTPRACGGSRGCS